MKLPAALAVSLALVGCATPHDEVPPAVEWTGVVTVRQVDAPGFECAKLDGRPLRAALPLAGCARTLRDVSCLIIIRRFDPQRPDFATAGEELLHCAGFEHAH